MRRFVGIGLLTVLAIVVWAGIVLTGARFGLWRSEIAPRGDAAERRDPPRVPTAG